MNQMMLFDMPGGDPTQNPATPNSTTPESSTPNSTTSESSTPNPVKNRRPPRRKPAVGPNPAVAEEVAAFEMTTPVIEPIRERVAPADRELNDQTIEAALQNNESLDYTEGLNRMGDLARLVILRYELAAKRRRQSLARQQARQNNRPDGSDSDR